MALVRLLGLFGLLLANLLVVDLGSGRSFLPLRFGRLDTHNAGSSLPRLRSLLDLLLGIFPSWGVAFDLVSTTRVSTGRELQTRSPW